VLPLKGSRRFGTGQRPASAALRDAGAKAILIRSEAQGGVPFDVVESKLHVAPEGPDAVSRTALVNRLRAAGLPTTLVVAPAGYGKTTLLSQWARRDVRPCAWVSIDERDNDPVVLLRHVVAALVRVEPLTQHVVKAFRRREKSIWDAIVPRLTADLASRTSPFVLVLDDADVLESGDSVAVTQTLLENIPSGSTIVLSGRTVPQLGLAALRVGGRLLELTAHELAFTRRETEILLRRLGAEPADEELTELVHRTEGWAAGVHLAALGARQGADDLDRSPRLGQVGGDDRLISDYFRSEYLSRLSPSVLRFLRRTSVLEKMCGPLCNAVVEGKSSARELTALEAANVFLVPLDRHRGWWRYHRLFRDVLRRELADHESELVPILNLRAAQWYEANGDAESALMHAHAAGKRDDAARILTSIARPAHHDGRVAAVERWLDLFDDDRLDHYPAVAIHGCNVHTARGRAEDAQRWLQAAERGVASRRKGAASARPWIAVMRAAICADGPEKMQEDAEVAVANLPKDDLWGPEALLVQGVAAVLLGDGERGDSLLADALDEAARLGATEACVVGLGERSLLAAARGARHEAEELAGLAYRVMEEGMLASYPTSALAYALSARSELRRGQWEKARHDLTVATALTPALTDALPWLAVQVRLELGRAYMTLRDREAARRFLEEAQAILATRPALGVLAADVARLERELAGMPEAVNGSAGLTAAELRVLPMLATHLSFREIGERLYLSRNTIKTQAISVYRKLGVSSRSEAVARAGDVGLLDAEPPPDERGEPVTWLTAV
jgi:LuxR family transcriptional regulator, maltose regulon positive regulatory protein